MAEHREAATISTLIYDAFSSERVQYTDGAFAVTTPGVAEIEERIKNRTVWVAAMNNAIVGTASCLPRGEGLFIRSVAVAREMRRKGIAKILMTHMEKL